MATDSFSRRNFFKLLGSSGLVAAEGLAQAQSGVVPAQLSHEQMGEARQAPSDRERRLKWWHQARFGMFIHWGLYSLVGQHEWVMENEGIPVPEYELLAQHFIPQPNVARQWAQLARRAGQRYMVMTSKHHEGFCMWDTKMTNYCAAQQGPKRDLVREFVEAAREEGIRVGLYYSLMDWHHPDGARCATDEAARNRFVDYTHGLIRELMSNYGKIDILWYDVRWPLNAEQWRAKEMNQMVFSLQPDIIVNDRNGLPGDFSTPEQRIEAPKNAVSWETCMTLNDSWGYQKSDDNWKSAKTIVRNLVQCSQDGGNYLLNIGPKADGSVPEESIRTLERVGDWLHRNGEAIYGSEVCQADRGRFTGYTRKGNTLYLHVHFWPADTPAERWLAFYRPASVIAMGGLRTRVKSARLLVSGKPLAFEQNELGLR
ncbi:MAG: alpha-L-fucosidase, partial [Acidobacteria bacterium]|nr:alpha-L-fucosidase [Acidobacteriota bacterium]